MNKLPNFLNIIFLLFLSVGLRFYIIKLLASENRLFVFLIILTIFSIGIYLIPQTARIIGETTGVLKNRTGLAGGFLQSLGTAFPDMVIGVVAAILSLQVIGQDYLKAINLAIIAASTTFGSNIYNILHAAWCIYRQNKADKLNRQVFMFPYIKNSGLVTPLAQHKLKPLIKEIDASLTILTFLSLLTASVALNMVIFGKVNQVPQGIKGDLYQLTKSIGFIILALSLAIIFIFRKSHHEKFEDENNGYNNFSNFRLWSLVGISGIIILFSAESIIEAVSKFSEITHFPYVLAGVITALIGCLGEMVVIHDFTVHPKGRITDALIGIAMDNIVTTMGAAFIAILGGIFLGSDALIIIFVMILFSNTLLMGQISQLKNFYLASK